jgi:hypothetical protein
MLVFNKYFYKNKKSKLCDGDRVAVLNDKFYVYRGSIVLIPTWMSLNMIIVFISLNLFYSCLIIHHFNETLELVGSVFRVPPTQCWAGWFPNLVIYGPI